MSARQQPGTAPRVRPPSDEVSHVTGRGCYVDDFGSEGRLTAAFLRSPHAHARILRIDAVAAREMPGVIRILLWNDVAPLAGGSLAPIPIPGPDGARLVVPRLPVLAGDRVVHVGQAVALVIAESVTEANDAAESIFVEYEPLQPAVGIEAATSPQAPQLWDGAPGNVALEWSAPDLDADGMARHERAFAEAANVVSVSLANERVNAASIEPRAAIAAWDEAADRYTFHCGSQSPTSMRDQLAVGLGAPPDKVRVVTPDVGGSFGMKSAAYPEYLALLIAARLLKRPVRWTATRMEAFVSDVQARDQVIQGELALDSEGNFLALRVRIDADLGAFVMRTGALVPTVNFAYTLSNVYRIPSIRCVTRCIFTNTVPTGAYRGAGRPEAVYLVERLVEKAARRLGTDPIRLRQQNMITAQMMPYRTAIGPTYDSGDFPALLGKALNLAGHRGFAERRRASLGNGKLRGIGLCCFLEHSGASPKEGAAIALRDPPMVRLKIGAQSTGQGHAPVFRDVIAKLLGVGAELVKLEYGDSDLGLISAGTAASRSTMATGAAIAMAAEKVIGKGRRVAAGMLSATESEIEFSEGRFRVAGGVRSLTLFEVARAAVQLRDEGKLEESLDSNVVADVPLSFPNGCHLAEVEIDPETGGLALVNYTAVDDSGNILDPHRAEGQVLGGIAQGVGQALIERAVYDDSGQPLTGSFMDYGLPRADDMSLTIATEFVEIPCTTNALGAKGLGEAGTTGALTAVVNAVIDALPGNAGLELDVPLTAEKIWRACRSTSIPAG